MSNIISNLYLVNVNQLYAQAYAWLFAVGPRIVFAIIALIVGEWIIKLIRKGMNSSMHRKNLDPSLRPFFSSLIQAILQILLMLAIIQIIGVQMTIFTALIGAFGVAAGLALSGTLQNFTSGILILLLKPYKVGDNISAQGAEGTVTSIQIFNTVITTYDKKTVIIPNSKLSNEVIINLSREGTRRLDIEIELSYGIPLEEVKKITEDTINIMDDLLKDPPYRIGISALGKGEYKLYINLWLPAHGFQDARLHFLEKLMDAFIAAGIKLPGIEDGKK